jgi:hypothetical protein
MNERRGNLYLLTGLLLGLALGLLVSWVLLPVQYVDSAPGALSAASQDEYRRTIALAYQSSGDLERARERLRLLNPADAAQALAAQAQRVLAENRPPQEARALALLAADLSRPAGSVQAQEPQAVSAGASASPSPAASATLALHVTSTAEAGEVAAVQTATPALPTHTPTATPTPRPTFTPRPTATPMRVLDSPFTLKSRQEICDGSAPPGLLQVYVFDAAGKPLPGVRVTVLWENGEDVFFTGLAPQISPGYGDFAMTAGVTYSLRVAEASKPVTGLAVPSCGGSVRLDLEGEG